MAQSAEIVISAAHFMPNFGCLYFCIGWYYGGGFSEIRDGHYVLPDGTLGRPVE